MQSPIIQSQQVLARAVAAHQAGNIAEAEFLYKLVLQADKKQVDALHMLGVIEAQRGNFSGGLERLKEALRIKPNSPDMLINLGRMQSELGDDAGALATYEKAVALDPRSSLAHSNMSNVLRDLGRFDEALAHCDTALEIAPQYADAWSNRGGILFDLDRMSEALTSYDRALAINPRQAGAHFGRANIHARRMQHDDALAAYEKAIAIRPDQTEYRLARGNLLQQLTRYPAALADYDKLIALDPNLAAAWYGRGMTLIRIERRDEAFTALDKAFTLQPDFPCAEGDRLFTKLQICSWNNLEDECTRLFAGIAKGELRANPFDVLVISPSLDDQRRCAELWARTQCPAASQPLWRGELYRHDRIRVAYLSADFFNHATCYLAAGLFEAHDRSRFETTAISFGPHGNDEMYARVHKAFDRFLDLRAQPDEQIGKTIRDLEIDIALDLKGFTTHSRPSILAQRAAPIQVNYLGFPCTMGAGHIDYIIADRTIIPAEHEPFYSEKVVWLPDSYQPNDNRRALAEPVQQGAAFGLPEHGFVFCSFNNSYKIRPLIFDIWMRLLQAVEGSVLWLLDENEGAKRNLRLEAGRRGVDPDRLVFAPRRPLAEHLARHRHADLFLDTLPCCAHTTASDALWGGCPLVTCLGTTLAGRVAASLLRAVGLPELVTESLADYEQVALKIAKDPALCAALKDKLARHRNGFPLFDTARYTRNIEAAYTTMWEHYQRGEAPRSFAVEAPAASGGAGQ
jgi:protein O-GlcNAc transferase